MDTVGTKRGAVSSVNPSVETERVDVDQGLTELRFIGGMSVFTEAEDHLKFNGHVSPDHPSAKAKQSSGMAKFACPFGGTLFRRELRATTCDGAVRADNRHPVGSRPLSEWRVIRPQPYYSISGGRMGSGCQPGYPQMT